MTHFTIWIIVMILEISLMKFLPNMMMTIILLKIQWYFIIVMLYYLDFAQTFMKRKLAFMQQEQSFVALATYIFVHVVLI